MLLREVARRVNKVVRSSDTVSRQGGDEFLIVLGGIADAASASTAAMKIVDQLTEPFLVNDLELTATCSLGIAMYPADGNDFDTLLKHADIAMYGAKESGRNAVRFYDAAMNSSVVERLQLVTSLRAALTRQELRLYYQPQFDLVSGRIVGAEALLRWPHPELGMIAPTRFIPITERSGLIHELGRWVINEACRQSRQWQDAGLEQLVVAVNLSPVQFQREEVERDVVLALGGHGLAPACLELELTESLLIADSDRLTAMLSRLRKLGVRLSIDDFGTGYSNLGYLKRFQVERLKIDRSFVSRLSGNSDDEGIVRAIIEMAHSLKRQVVAEGVEDSATLTRLVELGCELGQGFHWSRALPADEFFAFVRQRQTAMV